MENLDEMDEFITIDLQNFFIRSVFKEGSRNGLVDYR